MRVKCKLGTPIVGIGFNLKRGHYGGELDDRGVVWLEVSATHRMAGVQSRTVGVAASRFEYIEDAAQQAELVANGAHDRRAEVKAAIKAAEKAKAARGKKSPEA